MLANAIDTAQFQIDHYMAGLGATMTAAASLLGALAALGITRNKATKKANVETKEGMEQELIDAYDRGVERGAEIARSNS